MGAGSWAQVRRGRPGGWTEGHAADPGRPGIWALAWDSAFQVAGQSSFRAVLGDPWGRELAWGSGEVKKWGVLLFQEGKGTGPEGQRSGRRRFLWQGDYWTRERCAKSCRQESWQNTYPEPA